MPALYQTCDAAYLAPCRRGRGRLSRLVTTFGRQDGTGRAIDGWPLLISLDTTFAVNRSVVPDPDAGRLPAAIYGGLFFDWFGHFITETLPNLIAVAETKRAHPDLPVVFHLPDFWSQDPFDRPRTYPFHAEFLARIGLDPGDFLFLRAPLLVDRLLVPEGPFPRKYRYKRWLLDRIDSLFAGQSGGAAKVYMSRTRWPKPRIVDEPRVESRFREAGYEIIHPQDLSVTEQLAVVAGARQVAGPQGTALHWSLYSPACRSVISMGWGSPLQRGICASRGQAYFDPRGSRPWGGDLRLRKLGDRAIDRAIAASERAAGG